MNHRANGTVSIGCGPLASPDEDEKLEGGYASLKELVAELYNEWDEAAERSVLLKTKLYSQNAKSLKMPLIATTDLC